MELTASPCKKCRFVALDRGCLQCRECRRDGIIAKLQIATRCTLESALLRIEVNGGGLIRPKCAAY